MIIETLRLSVWESCRPPSDQTLPASLAAVFFASLLPRPLAFTMSQLYKIGKGLADRSKGHADVSAAEAWLDRGASRAIR